MTRRWACSVCLYQAALQFGEEDSIEWGGQTSGEYTVGSYYAMLSKKRAEYTIQPHEREDNFPHKHMRYIGNLWGGILCMEGVCGEDSNHRQTRQ